MCTQKAHIRSSLEVSVSAMPRLMSEAMTERHTCAKNNNVVLWGDFIHDEASIYRIVRKSGTMTLRFEAATSSKVR